MLKKLLLAIFVLAMLGSPAFATTYHVTNWAQLQAAQTHLYDTFLLDNDLSASSPDYSGIGDTWDPIGDGSLHAPMPISYFVGNFDGQGHTISDLVVNIPGNSYTGLFGWVQDGTIQNLTLMNPSVTGLSYTGALIGQVRSSGAGETVTNCHIIFTTNGISSPGGYGGGMIGQSLNTGVTTKCSVTFMSTGSVLGASNLGGMSRDLQSPVYDCYVEGYSTGGVSSSASTVGGFAGDIIGSIYNCYAAVPVYGTSNSIGGFVGLNVTGALSGCYSIGPVTTAGGATDVGGFIGSNSGLYPDNSGWYNGSGPANAIGNPAGDISFDEGTVAWFYDKTNGVYTKPYLSSAPPWDFATPVWYQEGGDYPKFAASLSKTIKGVLSVIK